MNLLILLNYLTMILNSKLIRTPKTYRMEYDPIKSIYFFTLFENGNSEKKYLFKDDKSYHTYLNNHTTFQNTIQLEFNRLSKEYSSELKRCLFRHLDYIISSVKYDVESVYKTEKDLYERLHMFSMSIFSLELEETLNKISHLLYWQKQILNNKNYEPGLKILNVKLICEYRKFIMNLMHIYCFST